MSNAVQSWGEMSVDERLKSWDREDARARIAAVPEDGDMRPNDETGEWEVYSNGRWTAEARAELEGAPIPARPAPTRQTRFTATELWNMDFPPVPWLVPDLLPPGLTILAGAPKLGKSWLALDICRAVSGGGVCLGDRQCAHGDVLYAALEDNPRTLKSRMRKSFPGGPAPGLTLWTEMEMLDAGGLEALRDWIESAAKPRLIVIDVLNKVRASKVKGEDSYPYDYRSVTPLKALADEFGIGVMIIHHTRKAEASDKLEKVSGTNGLTGAADTTWVLDRDGNGVTLSGRGRELAEFEHAVELDRDTCRWSVLGDAVEVRRSDERTAILIALKEAGEAISPTEIADVSGQANANVRFLLHKMVQAGEVIRQGRGKYAHPDINPPNIANIANIEDEP